MSTRQQAVQQGFSSRSRWLLQILGLTFTKNHGEHSAAGPQPKQI